MGGPVKPLPFNGVAGPLGLKVPFQFQGGLPKEKVPARITVAKQSFRLDTVGIAFTVIPYNSGLTLRLPSRAEVSERLTILFTIPLHFIQPRSTPSVATGMRAHFRI